MRNRFSLLLGPIALIAIAAPSGTHAGNPVGQSFACNRGSVLVGFQGHIGAWIDQFQPVCAPWDATNRKLGPVYAGDNFGNVNGGGPNLTTAICRPGSAVITISYGLATPNGPPGHVQNLDVQCAPITDPQHVDSYSGGGEPVMGSLPIPASGGNACSPGLLAVNLLIGLDGVNIASLKLGCDTPANIMAAAPQAAAAPPAPVSTPPAAPRPVISHLGHPRPPSSAPVQGSWFYSCSNASLYGNVLSASCKTTTGLDVATSLDLTTCNQPATAANINGKLVCESGVASAGGGTSGTPAPAPAPAPGPGPAAGVLPSDEIEGDWKSSEGPMTFTQSGHRHLDGTYAQDSGRIRAEREHGHWVGLWSESKSNHKCNHPRLGSDYWGQMDFVFTDGNRHFEGMWSYCDALPASGGKWTGDRIK